MSEIRVENLQSLLQLAVGINLGLTAFDAYLREMHSQFARMYRRVTQNIINVVEREDAIQQTKAAKTSLYHISELISLYAKATKMRADSRIVHGFVSPLLCWVFVIVSFSMLIFASIHPAAKAGVIFVLFSIVINVMPICLLCDKLRRGFMYRPLFGSLQRVSDETQAKAVVYAGLRSVGAV